MRDVNKYPEAFRFGGDAEDASHTRIIDLVLPEDSEFGQAQLLSDYTSVLGSLDTLGPDDFAQVPMLVLETD